MSFIAIYPEVVPRADRCNASRVVYSGVARHSSLATPSVGPLPAVLWVSLRRGSRHGKAESAGSGWGVVAWVGGMVREHPSESSPRCQTVGRRQTNTVQSPISKP